MFGLVPFGGRKDLARREDVFPSVFDIFNEPFFHGALAPLASGLRAFRVDVKDKGDAYEIAAELPGVTREGISLRYENSYLTIEATKNVEKEETGDYIRRERSSGTASRSFYIDDIDDDKISAEFVDGVLKVNLPKKTKSDSSRKIEIK